MRKDQRGALRTATESLIFLLVAVLLFRTFAAEGYMISTGSMAPTLLGFHKRVECPTCHNHFPAGVAYDDEDNPAARQPLTRAQCPNCGQGSIDLANIDRNHGDQLLVFKNAYLLEDVRRWEVIVFRNPSKPTEAYVKRAVGLPGETVLLKRGDVYINDVIARKTLAQQRQSRILVHDANRASPLDEYSKPHWYVESQEQLAGPLFGEAAPTPETTPPAGAWMGDGATFAILKPANVDAANSASSTIAYRHWIRARGLHETTVSLAKWPSDVEPQSVPRAGIRFNPTLGQLSCTGALPEDVRNQLLATTSDLIFARAIRELYYRSHCAPITDTYGYNPLDPSIKSSDVRDVMLTFEVEPAMASGKLEVEADLGSQQLSIIIDLDTQSVRLLIPGQDVPIRTGPLNPPDASGKRLIEVSLFDQQVAVATQLQEAFGPFGFTIPDGTPVSRTPFRIRSQAFAGKISNLRVYRDIYYTDDRSRHAVARPFQLGPHEYFVLGDNSPVSHDSRRWDHPGVAQSLLLGKPFLVHLPSKPGSLQIGTLELHLRLPDWDRIQLLK